MRATSVDSTFFHFYCLLQYTFTTYCFSVTLRKSFHFDCQADTSNDYSPLFSIAVNRYPNTRAVNHSLIFLWMSLCVVVVGISMSVGTTYAFTKDFCFRFISRQLNKNREKNSYFVLTVAAAATALTLQTHMVNLNVSTLCPLSVCKYAAHVTALFSCMSMIILH